MSRPFATKEHQIPNATTVEWTGRNARGSRIVLSLAVCCKSGVGLAAAVMITPINTQTALHANSRGGEFEKSHRCREAICEWIEPPRKRAVLGHRPRHSSVRHSVRNRSTRNPPGAPRLEARRPDADLPAPPPRVAPPRKGPLPRPPRSGPSQESRRWTAASRPSSRTLPVGDCSKTRCST